VSLSDWLQKKADASSLEACELALNNFCAAADTNSRYGLEVGDAIWKLLLSTADAADDPVALLAEVRAKMASLGPEKLRQLSTSVLEATSTGNETHAEAGRLVSCWFKAIALQQRQPAATGRALRVVRSYERTFASLKALLDREVQRSGEKP
jgi:hypothetical protein